MYECENGYCRNTAKLGEPFCGKCDAEIKIQENRKALIAAIREDLCKSASFPVATPMHSFHLSNAVSRLTQLIEELHDLA